MDKKYIEKEISKKLYRKITKEIYRKNLKFKEVAEKIVFCK